MTYIVNNDNGIVKWNTKDGEEYTFWTHADFIKPYIINYLKVRFPGKLIVRELNNVDLSIPEDNLPIEVQASSICDNHPRYSVFEQLFEVNRYIAIKGYQSNIEGAWC